MEENQKEKKKWKAKHAPVDNFQALDPQLWGQASTIGGVPAARHHVRGLGLGLCLNRHQELHAVIGFV